MFGCATPQPFEARASMNIQLRSRALEILLRVAFGYDTQMMR
jgi:hypothetical protein